jgi:hypothetical protein
MIKVILVFLAVMALLGMLGRAWVARRGGIGLAKGGVCPHCGAKRGTARGGGRVGAKAFCSCGER